MLSALQYVLKWFFGGVVFLWVLMVSACLGIKRQRNSSEIKYLNLVRWKVIGSSQDCTTVSNSIRERIIAAKISVGVSILIGIISNEYFTPPMATKCWTVIWHTVNSKWWLTQLYHALKWCKSFLVHQRENKRLGSGILSTQRCWKTIINKKEKPGLKNLKTWKILTLFIGQEKKKLKIHSLRTKDMYKYNSPLFFCFLSLFFLSVFLP